MKKGSASKIPKNPLINVKVNINQVNHKVVLENLAVIPMIKKIKVNPKYENIIFPKVYTTNKENKSRGASVCSHADTNGVSRTKKNTIANKFIFFI